MPNMVVYKSPNDVQRFDLDRYVTSLNRYDKVDKDVVKKAVDEIVYDPVHVSVLSNLAVELIPDETKAKQYYDDHKASYIPPFERLRRITGYLVGSLDHWNDAKRAEEKARVKHSVSANANGVYTKEQKAERELAKKEQELNTRCEKI